MTQHEPKLRLPMQWKKRGLSNATSGKQYAMYGTTKLFRAFGGGAVAFVLANIVSNILFFQLGRPFLFESEMQSPKIIAVLFEMEPLPLMFTNGPLYMAIAAVIGGLHGLVFAWIEPALPRGTMRRGLAYGAILWMLMAVYFEFHAPFNMFGEPPSLVALELGFWIAVVMVEGIVLSFLYGAGHVPAPDNRPAP